MLHTTVIAIVLFAVRSLCSVFLILRLRVYKRNHLKRSPVSPAHYACDIVSNLNNVCNYEFASHDSICNSTVCLCVHCGLCADTAVSFYSLDKSPAICD